MIVVQRLSSWKRPWSTVGCPLLLKVGSFKWFSIPRASLEERLASFLVPQLSQPYPSKSLESGHLAQDFVFDLSSDWWPTTEEVLVATGFVRNLVFLWSFWHAMGYHGLSLLIYFVYVMSCLLIYYIYKVFCLLWKVGSSCSSFFLQPKSGEKTCWLYKSLPHRSTGEELLKIVQSLAINRDFMSHVQLKSKSFAGHPQWWWACWMHLFNHRGGISEARDIPRKGGKPTCSRLKHEVFESLGSELSWADVYVDGAHSKFHRAVMELLLICDFCGILAAMNRFVFW